MNTWLKKSRQRRNLGVERDELEALLPVSSKAPEVQRFTQEDDHDDDQDLEFLNQIASQIAVEQARARADQQGRTENPKPRPLPSPPRVVRDGDEALQVFRETAVIADDDDRARLAKRVPPVVIGDLIDDLETTAAALRHRKAA
jgi:hypothetical protein